MPWSCDLNAALGSAVELQAFVATATIEYALFHDGETLTVSADS